MNRLVCLALVATGCAQGASNSPRLPAEDPAEPLPAPRADGPPDRGSPDLPLPERDGPAAADAATNLLPDGGPARADAGGDLLPATGDPLLGGLTDEQRARLYTFEERNGTVVIEGEHFVSQAYGNDVYRGKRWWMVNDKALTPKAHPAFARRCEEARQELMDLDTKIPGTDRTIASVITTHADRPIWTDEQAMMTTREGTRLGRGALSVFKLFGCDPDEPHIAGASGNAAIELLPDVLYDNNNAVPHAGSNWTTANIAPKVYYRVRFTTAGTYRIWIRAFRTDTDSGSLHAGITARPGTGEQFITNIDTLTTGTWTWLTGASLRVDAAGERFVILAGREDGLEVDKLVVSTGTCGACTGLGPPESPTVAGPTATGGPFLEQAGQVVAEMESEPAAGAPPRGWALATELGGFTGKGYYAWTGGDAFTAPAGNALVYRVRIAAGGTYQLLLRAHQPRGAVWDAANDVWVRVPTAGRAEGAADLSRWQKVYVGSAEDDRLTREERAEARMPLVGLWRWWVWTEEPRAALRLTLAPGVHTIEISGRSNGFALDRMVLGTPRPGASSQPDKEEGLRLDGLAESIRAP